MMSGRGGNDRTDRFGRRVGDDEMGAGRDGSPARNIRSQWGA